MPGKFESVEQVKEYEQQWHTLYEDTTSGLGEKVQHAHVYSRCVCIVSVQVYEVVPSDVWTSQLKKHSQLLNLEVFKKLR